MGEGGGSWDWGGIGVGGWDWERKGGGGALVKRVVGIVAALLALTAGIGGQEPVLWPAVVLLSLGLGTATLGWLITDLCFLTKASAILVMIGPTLDREEGSSRCFLLILMSLAAESCSTRAANPSRHPALFILPIIVPLCIPARCPREIDVCLTQLNSRRSAASLDLMLSCTSSGSSLAWSSLSISRVLWSTSCFFFFFFLESWVLCSVRSSDPGPVVRICR